MGVHAFGSSPELPAFAAAHLPTAGEGEGAREGREGEGEAMRRSQDRQTELLLSFISLRTAPIASLFISLILTSAAGASGLSIKHGDTDTQQLPAA